MILAHQTPQKTPAERVLVTNYALYSLIEIFVLRIQQSNYTRLFIEDSRVTVSSRGTEGGPL